MDSEFSRKKALAIGALVFVLIAVPVTVYIALQQQDSRSRAEDPIVTPTLIPTPLPTPPPTVSKCYECEAHPDVSTITTWTYNDDDTVTIRATISKTFTDNSYGVNSVGWPSKPRGHRFSDLVGSDNLNIALFDNSDNKVMEFQVDFLEASANVTSGYETLCVTGGDGLMIVGNENDVVGCKTSLSENFNTYGYVLTTDSPETDENYTLNVDYPNWIYEVWYEVTVKTAPFDAGGGVKEPIIADIHSSPSKKPDDTCIMTEIACTFTPTSTPTSVPSSTPLPSATPTIEPSNTLTPTPTLAPTVSPTTPPTLAPSFTPIPETSPTEPPVCRAPGVVENVRITCPNCSTQ